MVTQSPFETEIQIVPPFLPFWTTAAPDRLLVRPAFGRSHSREYSQPPVVCTSSQETTPTSSQPAGSRGEVHSVPSSAQPAQRSFNFSLPIGFTVGAGGYFSTVKPSHAISFWPFWGRKRTASVPQEQKRIVIMMSNTGGGHKASADALQGAFQELYGDKYQVMIVDMWKEHTPYPFNQLPDTYGGLASNGALWKLTYELTQPEWVHVPYFRTLSVFLGKAMHEAFEKLQPDLVVSVHPLMQHIPLQVLKHRARRHAEDAIHFATVVTDFTTCHNTWFHREVSKCFVPTQYCYDLAKENGLKDEQIVMHGLPIRPIFSKPLPCKRQMKKRMGLLPCTPAVLLIGGGEGFGKLEDTVEQLANKIGAKCQVVVVCGRNAKLQAKLKEKEYPEGMRVVVCGFVDNIHEWMAACDTIITKAGPGTIAEALISGLPILLNGNIPCQEEGNIPYIIDNKVGAFETDPPKIADIISDWLGPLHSEFQQMAKRSKSLGRPEAVYKIVRDLAALADTRPVLAPTTA